MNRIFQIVWTLAAGCVLAGMLCCCEEKKVDSRGSIEITSEPSGAMVSIFGKERSETPFRCRVPAVEHAYRLHVVKTGFQPAVTLVNVKPGEKKKVHLRLEPETSEVLIRSKPDKATVVFDNQVCGETPLVIRNLAPGSYRAKISRNGYAGRDISWQITSGRPVAVDVNLASNVGQLSVNSTPKGAEVVINGKVLGNTPFSDSMEEGVYQVLVRLEGFVQQSFQARVERGKTCSLPRVVLKKQPGSLKITTSPGEAVVYVNDRPYGKSPVAMENLVPGEYRIRAEKKGFDAASQTVNLTPGGKMTVELKLDSNTGIIEFVTIPAGIRIYMQGQDYGKTKSYPVDTGYSQVFRISNLQAGKYKLTLAHPRAVPNNKTVTFRLEKGETKRLENLSMWVPNIRITRKNGSVLIGRLKAQQNDRYEFEAQQGVSYWIPKSDVSHCEKIVDQD